MWKYALKNKKSHKNVEFLSKFRIFVGFWMAAVLAMLKFISSEAQ